MKYFIVVMAVLLQSAFVPFHLVLLVLLARSFWRSDSQNIWLAFASGSLLGILTAHNIAFYALFLIAAVQLVSWLRLLPFSQNAITSFLFAGMIIAMYNLVEQHFMHFDFRLTLLTIDIGLFLVFWLLVRFYEERIVGNRDIKLKVKRM